MKTLSLAIIFAVFAAIGFSQTIAPTISILSSSITVNHLEGNYIFVSATFNLRISATGTEGSNGVSPDYTFGFNSFNYSLYKNGVKVTDLNAGLLSNITIPSSGVTVITPPSGTDAFVLQANNTVSLPVTFHFFEASWSPGLNGEGAYSVGLDSVGFSYTQGSTLSGVGSVDWMAGLTEWRTSSVYISSTELHGSSAIPEPSTYAVIFGVAALGIASWRRKAAKTNSALSVSS